LIAAHPPDRGLTWLPPASPLGRQPFLCGISAGTIADIRLYISVAGKDLYSELWKALAKCAAVILHSLL